MSYARSGNLLALERFMPHLGGGARRRLVSAAYGSGLSTGSGKTEIQNEVRIKSG